MPAAPKRLLFDLAAIRLQVGDKVHARGEAYFQDDTVSLQGMSGSVIKAQVEGTEVYRVALALGAARPVRILAGNCSCPARVDFGLCKHMVATAFAANAAEQAGEWPKPEEQPSTRLAAWLATLAPEKLVKLVLDLADKDDELERKLLLQAATSSGVGHLASRVKEIKRALRQAGAIHDGYIEYRAMDGWAENMNDVLVAIEAIIAPGASRHVRPLLAAARGYIESAAQNGDDSNGALSPLHARLNDLTLKTRRADPPEPLELAQELFSEWMGASDNDNVPLEGYWPLLGAAGRDELERLARALWPSVLPKRRGGGFVQEYCSGRSELFRLLDQIAAQKGDFKARVALREEDARSAYDIFCLAEFLIAQGHGEHALSAAEAGHFEFADKSDDRLTGLLAELYRKAGEAAKADALLWNNFVGRPDIRSFQMLSQSAAGKAKTALEDKAIAHIGGLRVRRAGGINQRHIPAPPDFVALLFTIFCDTKRYDAAWSLTDAAGMKPAELQRLAEASIGSHCAKAIAVLRLLAAAAVSEGVGYQEPLRLIDLILKHASGAAADEAQQWLRQLSVEHKRKRTFITGLTIRLRQ